VQYSPSPLAGEGRGEGYVKMKKLARTLRANQTDTEQLLWRYLRNRLFMRAKFRRQQVIGPYIVDFVCFEQRLILELDGGQHAENVECDVRRTAFLESQKFQVVRFWNNEVLRNMEGVLETIRSKLIRISPHPAPLPQGERESYSSPRALPQGKRKSLLSRSKIGVTAIGITEKLPLPQRERAGGEG
jgi:very-short-patch-repair endonuclease